MLGGGFEIVDVHHQLRARILIAGAHAAQIRALLGQLDKAVFGGHQSIVARAVHVFNHKAHAACRAEAAHHRRHAHENARIVALAHFPRNAGFQRGGAVFATGALAPRFEPQRHLAVGLAAADAGQRMHGGHFGLLHEIIGELSHDFLGARIGSARRQGEAYAQKPLVFLRQKRGGQPPKQTRTHGQQSHKSRKHELAALQQTADGAPVPVGAALETALECVKQPPEQAAA